MVKFQVTEADRALFPEQPEGQWVLYMPGIKVYHFRDTEEEIDALAESLFDENEKLRTAR